MTRRLKFSWLLMLVFALAPGARAQGPAPALASLRVELWPDYDRHAVLVLLTGVLAADAPLPATVVLPFPDSGQLNAVARIDADGNMIDDIEYGRSPGELRLTTPDAGFRVEYYNPYRVDGSQYDFRFDWVAGFAVQRLEVGVQQPAHAESLVTVPPADRVVPVAGGLRNHVLPAQSVPAGRTFGVAVSYTMATPRLTVQAPTGGPGGGGATGSAMPSGSSALPPSHPPIEPPESTSLGWGSFLAILAAALVAAALVWQVWQTRAAPRAPAGESPTEEAGATPRFCHQCGRAVGAEQRFCGACGTAIPGR